MGCVSAVYEGCLSDAPPEGFADEDPSNWQGVEAVPVPWHWQQQYFRDPLAVINPDGELRCEICFEKVDGVRCCEDGRIMHFGCASEKARDAVIEGKPDSRLSLGARDQEASLLASADDTDASLDTQISRMLVRFNNRCEFSMSRYGFELEVTRIFVVRNRRLEMRFAQTCAQLCAESGVSNVKELYHGTLHVYARGIVTAGFKLPKREGMFGKGVYFAGTPLKSWQYSLKGENRGSTSKHYMFVCSVALGVETEMPKAGVPKRRSLWTALKERQNVFDPQCDSVLGLSQDQGGALRVPEYVVYRPAQALPRYLLELRERDRR